MMAKLPASAKAFAGRWRIVELDTPIAIIGWANRACQNGL